MLRTNHIMPYVRLLDQQRDLKLHHTSAKCHMVQHVPYIGMVSHCSSHPDPSGIYMVHQKNPLYFQVQPHI